MRKIRSTSKHVMNSPTDKHRFEEFLVEAVDEAFSSLGDSCKKAINFHLETTFNVVRNEIPLKIEEFVNAMEEIFGIGATILEIRIKQSLYQKVKQLQFSLKQQDLVFIEYVVTLRRNPLL